MMTADPYATKVLFPEHHAMLVQDIDNYALEAGIVKHWIWSPLADHCGPEVVEYAKKFKLHAQSGAIAGLCFTGKLDADTCMSALAGCLTRNFIGAKVMTLTALLDAIDKNAVPEARALLVPNFFHSIAEGGKIAPWQTSGLLDLLTRRRVAGQQTIIYVSDVETMSNEYGLVIGKFVKQHFQIV